MFLDEFPKDLQRQFLMKDFIAGWQNKSGKVKVMIIGTAPGVNGAAINRKPLSNSNSGKILWRILRESGYADETIYITNLIKYPLLNNRDPTQCEIIENKPILEQEILKYRPNIIICLGKQTMSLFKLTTYTKFDDPAGILLLAINHPGYYARKPSHINDAITFLKANRLA